MTTVQIYDLVSDHSRTGLHQPLHPLESSANVARTLVRAHRNQGWAGVGAHRGPGPH